MAYAIHHGEVFQATYQQLRFSPPGNTKILLNDIDPLRPLAKLPPGPIRPILYDTVPDLVAPYSQQYNLQWETNVSRFWQLRLGYVGSRSLKLFVHWYLNRGRVLPGVELTTANTNDRRADPRFNDIRRVFNSGRAYFDAARATIRSQSWRGFTMEASYWFSKNIDTGGDYTSTAYDQDSFRGASQSEDNVNADLRGLSRFDQPHAFLSRFTYSLPSFLKGWSAGGIILLKSGTPFNIMSGSDAPGVGNVDGGTNDRVHIIDPVILGRTIGHPNTSRQRMPRPAFAFIQPGELRGSIGRNTFRRGGIYNVNASVERAWKTPHETELRFRAESVNSLNTPQFAEPGNQLADSNFANITNTLNDGRTFRFQLAFRF